MAFATKIDSCSALVMRVVNLVCLGLSVFILSACDQVSGSKEPDSKHIDNVQSISADDLAQLQEIELTSIATDDMPFSKKETHVFLGTGSVQGAYFPIGGVICRLLNRHKALNKVRCSLESTSGSIYNLRELREGNFSLVVSQSDWQYHAYNGTSTFEKEGPNKALRAVFALEADPITLIVKKASGIDQFEDLQGKKVSLGYGRSLQHRVINDFLDAMDWSDDMFADLVRVSDPNQIDALCKDDVEAALFLMSSLDDYLRDLDPACELKFVALQGEPVKKVISEKP